MLIPISWLKDFVDIKIPLKDLMWKMTEAGLTCESYKKIGDNTILDVEVTANRPDWMSITGVAREIAAIQGIKANIKKPEDFEKPKSILPIKLNPNFELFERWAGIVISNIKIKSSPSWLQEKIRLMGHTPINNVIDITNYVMYELGIPMHAFDYDAIKGSTMTVAKSYGGEDFTSVDGTAYKLPKDAIIINDAEKLIDLAGIKGGLNSGIKDLTKNIFLHVTINNPVLIRRASIALGLRSEASAIYERGPDKGGVIDALKRASELILSLAGGEIASNLIDLKKKKFEPWNLSLSFAKLEKVLGIKIEDRKVLEILKRLDLNPKKNKNAVVCTIPTYRGDIKIEEDLIEEVARIYGYNKFPKTLPFGKVRKEKIPYYLDDTFHLKIKELLTSSGLSEVKTLSLISTELIEQCNLDPEKHIRVSNPVSIDYEHMRVSLIPSLMTGFKLNREAVVQIFELDKIYLGPPEKSQEIYKIAGVIKGTDFRKFKGILDLLLQRLNILDYQIEFETRDGFWHPNKAGGLIIEKDILGYFGEIDPQVLENLGIKEVIYAFELNTDLLQKHSKEVIFRPIAEFPPQIEDITLTFPPKTKIGDVTKIIAGHQPLITNIELQDIYEDSYTFRIWYRHPTKTLTDKEVESIRNKALALIKSKFGGVQKV